LVRLQEKSLIKQRQLKLFGQVARADQAGEDHSRVLRASLNPPSNWRRPTGRPRHTWLPTISDDDDDDDDDDVDDEKAFAV